MNQCSRYIRKVRWAYKYFLIDIFLNSTTDLCIYKKKQIFFGLQFELIPTQEPFPFHTSTPCFPLLLSIGIQSGTEQKPHRFSKLYFTFLIVSSDCCVSILQRNYFEIICG